MTSPRVLILSLLLLACAASAQAQDAEYLIEGRDKTFGTFNGQLFVRDTDDGLKVTRQVHYLTHGSERLRGTATRSGSSLRARFPFQSGLAGRLTGQRRKAVRLWVHFYEGDTDIATWSKQGQNDRSSGVGVRVLLHKRNRLRVADRRPKLVKDTHTYKNFPGEAFIKGEGDAHEVDINDVSQGGLGDCYFMAGLAAVARTDPHRIRSMIRTEPNGSFSVTIFRHNDQWEETNPDANGYYTQTVKAVRIIVDDAFPAGADGTPSYAWFGDTKKEGDQKIQELWPMILEKAWAQHRGSYGAIEGGWASTPMSFFSAKAVWDGNPRELSEADLRKKLEYAERMNYPVTFGVPSPGGDHDLLVHDDHYYTFYGLTEDGRVRLYNPWGVEHPTRALTMAEMRKLFDGMHVGRF